MFATFAVDSCLNGQAADYPYRDHFHTSCPGQPPDAQALLQAFVGAPPAWAQALMRARDRLMAPLGLKTADLPRQAPQARVGEAVGVFENDRGRDTQTLVHADKGPRQNRQT
jgi:hypothetical protein